MAYSTSRVTLERMLPHLSALVEGKPCTWRVEANQAWTMAYKLREALYVARMYPQDYPELAEAGRKFRIVVDKNDQVSAVPVRSQLTPAVTPQGMPFATAPTGAKRLAGIQTSTSVIQYWMDTQPSNDKYYFPEARLDEQDLYQLWQWTEKMGWIFFVNSDGGLTLQKTQRDLEEFAWSPDDMMDPPET